MISYATAMTIYFANFGLTMCFNPDLFWGPNSPMMLP